MSYHQEKLSEDQIKQIEALPGWVWNKQEFSTQEAITCLKEYIDVHGNAAVPQHFVSKGGFKLGSWVSDRRKYYKQGKLDVSMIATLEELPGWIWDTTELAFQENLSLLRSYIVEYGHSRVPSSYKTENGRHLGAWVSKHRKDFKKGKITDEKAKQLEALIGWVWDPIEAFFPEALSLLRSYAEEHGHLKIARSYMTADGHSLGHWASERRRDYNKGKLSEENIKLLEALPGWVWSN